MAEIKTVTQYFGCDFKNSVQILLDDGYKILSSNCGILNYTDGASETIYQAILIKEDK